MLNAVGRKNALMGILFEGPGQKASAKVLKWWTEEVYEFHLAA